MTRIYHVLLDAEGNEVFRHWNKQDCYHYQNHIRPDTVLRTVQEAVVV